MYALLYIGICLEPAIGKVKFLISYLITGIIASMTSIWWYAETASVGASGAIFGMYGVFLALLAMNAFSCEVRADFLASTIMFVLTNILMGLGGQVDNAAHIGGFLSGLFIGYIIYLISKRDMKKHHGPPDFSV